MVKILSVTSQPRQSSFCSEAGEVPQPSGEVAQLSGEVARPSVEVEQPSVEVAQPSVEVAQLSKLVAKLLSVHTVPERVDGDQPPSQDPCHLARTVRMRRHAQIV